MGRLVKGVTCTVEQRTQCTEAIASNKETVSNKSIVKPDPQLPRPVTVFRHPSFPSVHCVIVSENGIDPTNVCADGLGQVPHPTRG